LGVDELDRDFANYALVRYLALLRHIVLCLILNDFKGKATVPRI
jgi:hypothetical protein